MWTPHSVVLEVYGVLTFTFYALQFWCVAPITLIELNPLPYTLPSPFERYSLLSFAILNTRSQTSPYPEAKGGKGGEGETPLLAAAGDGGTQASQTPQTTQADLARPGSFNTYSSSALSGAEAAGSGSGGSIAYPDPGRARMVEVCPVGYREDPQFFLKCLQSIKELTHSHMRVAIMVDGNTDAADWAMVQVVEEVTPHH